MPFNPNVFGATRTGSPIGQIAGSEFAKIFLGGTNSITLGQQFQAQFGRQLKPIMSIGDQNVYFVPGQGQGTISIGRLIGGDGLFSMLNSGVGECGSITGLQLQAGSGRCLAAETQTVNFGGGMLENVSMSLNAGTPEILESYSIRISSLEKVATSA
jgi:hypothetical protein